MHDAWCMMHDKFQEMTNLMKWQISWNVKSREMLNVIVVVVVVIFYLSDMGEDCNT